MSSNVSLLCLKSFVMDSLNRIFLSTCSIRNITSVRLITNKIDCIARLNVPVLRIGIIQNDDIVVFIISSFCQKNK